MGQFKGNLLITEHYSRYLGHPSSIMQFNNEVKAAPKPIAGLEFSASKEDSRLVYATLGASKKAMDVSQAPKGTIPRFELCTLCNCHDERVRENLVNLAIYPFYYNTFLDDGHIMAGDRPITPASSMKNLLFIRADFVGEGFDIVDYGHGRRVKILCVIPIHDIEYNFIKQNSSTRLLELFTEQQIDISDLSRPSIAITS